MKKNSPLRLVIEILLIVIVAIGLATLFTRFVMQPYEIPSGSMEQTIEVGDRVFSEKVSYMFGDPVQGDIITFEDPADFRARAHQTRHRHGRPDGRFA